MSEEQNDSDVSLPVLLFVLVVPPMAFIFGGIWVGVPVLVVAMVSLFRSMKNKASKS
ncbi:MAG: hypothetical protein KAJ19_05790 [Gammaproteobacteria bacterium]|nr:hypothetical protein [Gammaproteobacteria bacterium]